MPRHILMPYRGTPRDDTLLEMVCRMARSQNARVTAARFVAVPMSVAMEDETAPGLSEANDLMDKAENLARTLGLKIHTDVFAVRDAGAAIAQAASDMKADLIIMEAGLEQEEISAEQNRRVVQTVLDRAACEVWIARM